MTKVTSFAVSNSKNAFFFCPMRLRSLDSGRRNSTKSPSPPFEAARPFRLRRGALVDFAEALRSAHSNARRFAAPRFSAARMVVFLFTIYSAKIAFRDRPYTTKRYGRFCGTFSAAPARFFTSAQVFAPSRPAKGSAPFDPRQGAPCTCPAPPFMAKPGLCFTYLLALENQMLIYPIREQSVSKGRPPKTAYFSFII